MVIWRVFITQSYEVDYLMTQSKQKWSKIMFCQKHFKSNGTGAEVYFFFPRIDGHK